MTEEENEEDIYLAQTVQHTNDNIKHKFQEPGFQKTLRSTTLATQSSKHIQFRLYHETITETMKKFY